MLLLFPKGCRCRSFYLLLIMILLTYPCLLMAQAAPENMYITLPQDRIKLKNVFDEIKKQTNYDVVYNPTEVDVSEKVSVQGGKQLLNDLLRNVLGQRSLDYSFMRSSILVVPRKTTPSIRIAEPASEQFVTGQVIEEKSRSPLFGVSVVLKRTGKGTQSDAQGIFKLKDAAEGDTVIFSIIGYEAYRQTVPKTNLMRVALKIAQDELDQAVVQAYGTTTRRQSTGTIVKVSGDEIRKQPNQNPLMALIGRVPGMTVTPTFTYAHAPIKVEIRGRKSLNPKFSGEPLYVVDGLPINTIPVDNSLNQYEGTSPGAVIGGLSYTAGQSPLFGFNQNDIESIEILMDADATAMYGARGGNGVILITTKRPKGGKTTLQLDVNQTRTDIPYFPKYLSPSDYYAIRREAFRNDGIAPTPATAPDLLVWDTTRVTDWQREFYGPGAVTTINAGLSGGDENASISLSSQYIDTKGMNHWTGANKAFGLNLNTMLKSRNKKLSVGLSARYLYTHTDAIYIGALPFNLPPNAPPVLDAKGNPNYEDWENGTYKRSYEWDKLFKVNETRMKDFNTGLVITYHLFNNLTWNSRLGYATNNNDNDFFEPIRSQNPAKNPKGSAIFGVSKSENLTVSSTINFNERFGNATVGLDMGFEGNKGQATGSSIMGSGYTNDNLIRSLTNAPIVQAYDASSQRRTLGSFARATFLWDEKYIFKVSFNRDGSSQFGSENQFGNFGSVGAAWTMSEEKWFKKIMPSWFDYLKFSSNYGITGSNGVGDYQYLSQWSSAPNPTSSVKLPDYNGLMPFVPLLPVNQRYQWEKSRQFSIISDLAFLKNRLTINVNWYRNLTDHQITDVPTPSYTGFSSVKGNTPSTMLNQGWSVSATGILVRTNDIRWTAALNAGANRNMVKSFPDLAKSPWASRYRVGKSTSTIYLLRYLGVDPLTGLAAFEDHNKDGVVNTSSGIPGDAGNDRYLELDMNPMVTGSFQTSFSYKGFSFFTTCTFEYKWMQDPFLTRTVGSMNNFYLPAEVLSNTWRKPGDIAKYPRFSNTSSSVGVAYSDMGYSKVFFLRIGGINLAYQLPPKYCRKMYLNACSISLGTSNLFTITEYKGVDPVTAGQPIQRQINAKLSITI